MYVLGGFFLAGVRASFPVSCLLFVTLPTFLS
ncbi:hypothetical protein PhaeoP13_03675 (plasmid) [Phaeobacter piscinae]|uniref:Uncharacterized protein n=1 Tax=Phaeobacter piscinae TaxID=1580596 RepID=A0AAN1LCD6_9RHOB|nr:hypothetical protein PhaeoP13_03675 [Phaeobacter piscinae]